MSKSFKRLNIFEIITGVKPPSGFLWASSTLSLLILVGTFFYHFEEGWTFFDSFYFTIVTITTVGYGDLYPTTPNSKIFTLFLILMGVGIGLFVFSSFAEGLRKGHHKRLEQLEALIRNRF